MKMIHTDPRSARRFALLPLSALVLALFALSACWNPGSHGMAPAYSLRVTTELAVLSSHGRDYALVEVEIVSRRGEPAPIGASVFLNATNASVNGTGTEYGDSFVGDEGTAIFQVACSGTGTIQMIALYEGSTGTGPLIDCVERTPEPAVGLSVSVTPPRYAAGEVVLVDVIFERLGATPVPADTRVIPSESGGLELDDWGYVSGPESRLHFLARVVPAPRPGPHRVCFALDDGRFETREACASVAVVLEDGPPTCAMVASGSVSDARAGEVQAYTTRVWDGRGQPMAGTLEFASSDGSARFYADPHSDVELSQSMMQSDENGVAYVYAVTDPGVSLAATLIGQDGSIEGIDCSGPNAATD